MLRSMSNWNDRFKARMTALGITQAEVARACKVSDAAVSDWQSGKTKSLSADSLLALAHALHCNPHWLYHGGHGAPDGVSEARHAPYVVNGDAQRMAGYLTRLTESQRARHLAAIEQTALDNSEVLRVFGGAGPGAGADLET